MADPKGYLLDVGFARRLQKLLQWFEHTPHTRRQGGRSREQILFGSASADGPFPFHNHETSTTIQGGSTCPPYGCVMGYDAVGTDAASWYLKITAATTEWNQACYLNGATAVAAGGGAGLSYDGAGGPIIALVKFPSWMEAVTGGVPDFGDAARVGLEVGPTLSTADPGHGEWYLQPSYPSIATIQKTLCAAPSPFEDCWWCEVRYHDLTCGPDVQGQATSNVYRDTPSFSIIDVRITGERVMSSPTFGLSGEALTVVNPSGDDIWGTGKGKRVDAGDLVFARHALKYDITNHPYGTYIYLDSPCGWAFE